MIFKKLGRLFAAASVPYSDANQQRRSLLFESFLTLTLIALGILTLTNILELFLGNDPAIVEYLIEDALVGIVLVGLFILNRRGWLWLSSYLFLASCLISFPLLLPPEWRIFSVLVYIIPIQGSSFIIRPTASFIAALGAILLYVVTQIPLPQIDVSAVISFCGILSFFAVSAWFVADKLETALDQSHQSELRYLSLLEKNPFCVYMISESHAGRWVYISPRIQDLLGISPQEWLAQAQMWRQKVHPADLPAVLAEIERCQKTLTPFQAEYRMLRADGKVVWVSDSALQISTPDQPNRIQGVLLDITARKRVEQVQAALYNLSQAALVANNLDDLYRKIHAVLGELMHAENFFIALYDPATDTLNFPYFVDQYDTPPEPVIARHGLTEYVLRTGQPVFATAQDCTRLVALGEISDIGSPSVDWLGVPLIVNNRTLGVMTVQSYTESIRFSQAELDILKFVSTQVAMVIERTRNAAALREINQLTSEVISGVNTGIAVYDQAGRHLIWNHYLEQMTGLPKEAVIGQPAGDIFTYSHEIGLGSIFQHALAGNTEVIPDVEYTVPRSGKSGWLAGYCGPHHNAQGETIGVIAVINDITARKQVEEALRTAVSEKEVMMREIHHRVKNNLQVMSSLISLQADTIADSNVQGHFREMQLRVRSMALVHEELYQSQDFSRVNIAEYIENLTTGLTNSFAINPNVTLEVNVAPIFLAVDVAIPCGLILNELVTNAFKHAFPNGLAGEVNVNVQPLPDGLIQMQVSDNGVGMPAEIDIYNTDTLGMQLVTILTRQLRGTLQVDWRPNTCFRITFPESRTPPRKA